MSLKARAASALSFASTVARGAVEGLRDGAAGRRVWAGRERACVEARGLHDVEVAPGYVEALESTLTAADGVRWAAVNDVLGDVIVDFDPERISVARLRQIVAEVERAHVGTDQERDRPPRPSDFEQLFDRFVELAGDLVAATLGVAGRVTPLVSLPPEAMAVKPAVDLLPGGVRARMEQRFGAPRVELLLSLLGSVLSAASQAPVPAVVGAALRVVQLREVVASQRAWERRAAELAADYRMARAGPSPAPGPRPTPLPEGAAERYAQRARIVTELAAAPLFFTGGAGKAARAVMLGAPKAATMGADAFVAELSRLLAERGVVVRDPDALRCLDRVDAVVFDASALTTGRMSVAEVVTAGRADAAERARQRVHRMFDPRRPTTVVRDGRWRLGPLDDLDVPVPQALAAALRTARTRHDAVSGLARDGRLVAVVALRADLDPLARMVVSAARELGRAVVAPARRRLVDEVGADGSVPGGSRLAGSVRALQAEGHVVAVVAAGNEPALAAADCGVAAIPAGGAVPWSAHLLCGPGLVDTWLVLQAAKAARASADRSVHLALLGAVIGALVGLTGPERDAGRRGLLAVNAAALASIAANVWSVNRLADQPAPESTPDTPWHALAVEDTLRELGTRASGLSEEQVTERGVAQPDESGRKPESMASATVAELDSPLTAPLAAGAALSAATGSIVDAGLVAAAIGGNAVLGAVQRVAAGRAVRALSAVGAVQARLRRDGRDRVAPATELVPGDVVVVQAGDVVPADCRLIEASELEADESSLTGESMLVAKDPAATSAAAVADRSCMLYAGTTVAAGTGTAVVVATGRGTESGRSAAASDGGQTPGGVEAKLARMTTASLPVAAGAAGAVVAAGLLRGRLRQSIPSAVALAVAAVPEGLPFAATAAQLAAARRLSRRGVLVRSPRTLEALGRVDVVCFDKTGTLTDGKIDLRRVSDGRVDEPLDALTGGRRGVLAAALRASPADHKGQTLPHPADRAVNRAAEAAGIARDDAEPDWRAVRELPFESGRGFHAVLGRSGAAHIISVKGAPETVLPRCAAVRDDAGIREMSAEDRRGLQECAARLARSGYRVLAVAERRASDHRELDPDRIERLEFLGFLGLADPVRPTAATAIDELRRAGVEVVMLTGDHPDTATAVASELGMLDGRSPVTGPELDAADERARAGLATGSTMFARVSPTHKVAIVRALQQAGRVVAVTGDGANDAPAIRLADVGIAVGEASTEASRQAADIVVADERIELIVDAVIESRGMWRSVRDSVELLLAGNLGEILFTTGSSLASANPPLNPRQLLLINLLTDLVPALAVAVRPPRHATPETLLREGPDAAVGSALTGRVARRAVATAAATTGGWLAARATGTNGRASTVALTSLVGAQLAQTAMTAKGDPVVLGAVGASAAALAGVVQFPPTSVFFGCRPLGPVGWGITAAASAAGAVLGASLPEVGPRSADRG